MIYLLIIFWAYGFFIKIIDFKAWQAELHNQIFTPLVSQWLSYALPLVFLLLCLMLANKARQREALYGSLGLLLSFNIYIMLVWLNVFDRIPCSCAAIVPGFSWLQQFLLNTGILVLIIISIYLNQKERREEEIEITSYAE